MHSWLLGLPLIGLVGCLMPTGFGTGVGTHSGSGAGGASISEVTGENAALPTGAAEFLAFLKADGYGAYPHEPESHVSVGPHGGPRVRRFYQPKLNQSLAGAALEHPAGAGAVLELYGTDATTRTGWVASVKLDAFSESGQNWYWLEALDGDSPTLVDAGQGLGICTQCHAGGDDFVLGGPL